MRRDFEHALAEARRRRRALRATLEETRLRLSPPELAADVLSLIDPKLRLLHRATSRIQNNRLLSLAVLAGVGWLVGAPRQNDGEPPGARSAGTSPLRANMKEKKNDSGQVHGKHWSRTGAGRQERRQPQEQLAQEVNPRRGRKAQPHGGLPKLGGEPQQQVGGQRKIAEQQQDEKRPQQRPQVRHRI
jgi:hypothetical protein